jgi:hypothetical protein
MTVGSRFRWIGCGMTVVVAALAAASAYAVPPPPSGSFSGSTAQTRIKNHRVRITTDANGHVSKMKVGWRAKCRKKGFVWDSETAIDGGPKGLAQKGDTFHFKGSYASNSGGGTRGLVTVVGSGAFSDNDHAQGLWSAYVTVKRKGKTIDRCKAEKVKWKVKRSA